MKKITLLFIILMTVSIFIVSCNSRPDTHNNLPEPEIQPYTLEEPDAIYCGSEPDTYYNHPEHETPSFTIEDALYDFDYLIQLMQDTFPYFDVAKRRAGVFPLTEMEWIRVTSNSRENSIDILELAKEARTIIENYPYSLKSLAADLGIAFEDMPVFDEHVFWSIVTHEFFGHFWGFGHSSSLNHFRFNWMRATYSNISRFSYPLASINTYVSRRSEVFNFYSEQEALFHTLSEEDPTLFQFIFRMEPPQSVPYHPPVVSAEIIEEDRIAYLRITTFLQHPTLFRYELLTFYREIQNYDHLIIDIRGNGGGNLNFPRMLIMYPLWVDRDNMPDMPLFSLHVNSERGHALAGYHFTETERGRTSQFVPQSDEVLTIKKILEIYQLPYLHQDCLQNLSHGMRLNTSLNNITRPFRDREALGSVSPIPFEGQIWLLVDDENFSSSAMFARQAKHMGFATLVGEQIGGMYTSTVLSFFSLPNSGIVLQWDIDYLVDEYGRALNEFPTKPHHFNRPGMDALETTLALIAEGIY